MNIALMSWHSYYNYGTFLQAAALSYYLKKTGHKVDLIKYDPEQHVIRQSVNNTESLIEKLKKRIQWQLGNYNQVEQFNGDKFDEFAKINFSVTINCNEAEKLKELNNLYDAFICGSDQIWSPVDFDPNFYLDFVEDKRRTIAYAPSFGISSIDNIDMQKTMGALVKQIRFLSVREVQGAEIIKELTGDEAKVVVDPTILLNEEDWVEFLELRNNEDKYLLIYYLGNNSESWKIAKKIAVRQKLPIKIIPVYPQDKKRDGCINRSIGPREFVDLIKNASYVCTDSYHAVLFSILYQTNFACVKRFSDRNKLSQNSRLYSLLEKLELEDRLIDSGMKLPGEILNYDIVHDKLSEWRKQSSEFILTALDKIQELEINE